MKSKQPAKYSIKARTDILNFGQYFDKTVQWVLENDPSYILWLDWAEVAEIAEDIVEEAQELDYGDDD